MPQVGALMQPIETIIRQKFLPTLFGSTVPVTDNERKLYALPGRLSGLGEDNPVLHHERMLHVLREAGFLRCLLEPPSD